ncbi:hypothetical protein OROHE_002650 [Orobanche hederae]
MPRFSVFACSVLRSWFANLLLLLYSMISPYIMQKMEGISYDHRRFIFARKNLHDDGVPFGDYNYRRAITSARYIFSASGIVYCSTNSTPPFTAYHNYPSDRLNSEYNNHGLFDVFIQNKNNLLQLNNTIQVACEYIGTSSISGRKRKKKSKETDTTLYMFKIRVKDPTGELDVTVFGEHGMNIFNMKEYQFKAKYSSDSTIDRESINGRD